MEETLERIKKCDDFELFAWKQDMDEYYEEEGFHHNEDVYRAVVNEIESRKSRREFVADSLEKTASAIVNGLIQEGYTKAELNVLLECLQNKIKALDSEKSSNNRSK